MQYKFSSLLDRAIVGFCHISISHKRSLICLCFALLQITDVFSGKTYTVKDSTDFVVSVDPTGVVMWHISAPARQKQKLKLKLNPLSKLKLYYHGPWRSTYRGGANDIPNVNVL